MWNVTSEEFKKNTDEYLKNISECNEKTLVIETETNKLVVMTTEHYFKARNKALGDGFQLGLNHAIKSIDCPSYEGEEQPHAGIICSSFDPETGTFDDIIEVTKEDL